MDVYARRRVALILAFASMLLLMISGFIGYAKYQTAFKGSTSIIETYQTIRAANQTIVSIDEAALAVSTFIYSKNPDTIKNLPELIISAQLNMATLFQLTQDNPIEIEITKNLNNLFNQKIDFLQKIIYEYSAGHPDAALSIALDQHRLLLTSQITQLIIEIKTVELNQLNEWIAYTDINKIKADNFFIRVGIINILFLLFNFIFISRFMK